MVQANELEAQSSFRNLERFVLRLLSALAVQSHLPHCIPTHYHSMVSVQNVIRHVYSHATRVFDDVLYL